MEALGDSHPDECQVRRKEDQHESGFDAKSLVKKVNREDLWRDAAKSLGVAAADIPASTSRGQEKFFDGKVFDPENPSAYLKSLTIKRVEV